MTLNIIVRTQILLNKTDKKFEKKQINEEMEYNTDRWNNNNKKYKWRHTNRMKHLTGIKKRKVLLPNARPG